MKEVFYHDAPGIAQLFRVNISSEGERIKFAEKTGGFLKGFAVFCR